MKRVTILGHFALGREATNGQTIKTKIITDTLKRQLGATEIGVKDTHGGWLFLLQMPIIIFRMLVSSRNVIIMPAYKGVRVITPLMVLLNCLMRRRLHYVVIGGWLPDYARRFPVLRLCLKHLHHIYVETNSMKQDLEQLGLANVCVMPNCKPVKILSPDQLPTHVSPYKLCTFSRVIKEKGIEEAIAAVNLCNQKAGRTLYMLDIYGQIEQEEWFDSLMRNQPETISYKGIVPFEQTTETLKDYFLLLFPTYYRGEGFAGTLIDAMSAGVPVVASDWHSNTEIIENEKTGMIIPVHSVDALAQVLAHAAVRPDNIQAMRNNCILRAESFQPDRVIQVILNNLS